MPLCRRVRHGERRGKLTQAGGTQDVTVLVLLGAGVLSLVLGLAVEGGDSWIEGAAIMAAVAVVVLVSAVNNFQKEAQFRELNKLNEDTQVCGMQRAPVTS